MQFYKSKIHKIIDNIKYVDAEYAQYLIDNNININEKRYEENVYDLIHNIK